MASRRLPFPPLPVAPPPPVSQPLNSDEVIALVRDAIHKAIQDEETRPAEPGGLKTGITLDLIGKNIPVLPDEVVDILRQGVIERLALSHNYLRSLPARFSQCTSLRYLAARNNAIEVFPIQICELTSLEFLDLGRNKLRELPPEISKLTALKALSIHENQITTLPTSLADMPSLQRLRVSGNPIKYPPKEILQVSPQDLSPNEMMPESEVDRLVTDRVKKFLARSLSISSTRSVETMSETETGDDESIGNPDIPRLPAKRPVGGRFPVRVKGSEIASSPSSRSPSISRPPPRVSSRRSLSQYSNGYTRRPGIIPLAMVKSSDSLRSAPSLSVTSPDTQGPGSSSSRSTDNLTVVNTLSPGGPVMNRFSTHLRGFSYSGGLNCTNPVSPEDPSLMRPLYVRELSALPVRRYQTQVPDPVLDFARGVLYSIYQIHLGVQTLMSLTNEGGKRSSLEMIFYNTNTYFVELEQAIQDYDLSLGTRGASRDHGPMQRAYATLIQGYIYICSRLRSSVDLLVDNGDSRYMRSFLMLIYHSITELRVAMSSLGPSTSTQEAAAAPDSTPPPRRAQPRPTAAPFQTPPSANSSAGQFQTPPSGSSRGTVKRASLPKHPMQVQTNIPYRSRNQPVAVAGGGQAYSNAQLQALRTPPLSNESFTSAISSAASSIGNRTPDITRPAISSDSDRQFERFFRSLTNLTNLIARVNPKLDEFFTSNLSSYTNNINDTITPNRPFLPLSHHQQQQKWEALIYKTAGVARQAEYLRGMLTNLRLRDPGLLDDSSAFWTTCRNLFSGWTGLGIQIREVLLADKDKARYDGGMVEGLRMITKGVKDSIALMGEVKKQQQLQQQQQHIVGRTGRSNTYGSPSPGILGDSDLTLRTAAATTPQSAAMSMGMGMPVGTPMGGRGLRKFSSP
ncbi:RAM signaling pathway protein-domain-containing protein [Cladorrhinum sp. PSN332]|nr:RAM signaling pathway protein-domain-containing protein [Cladorrhinum sp. PSN332]